MSSTAAVARTRVTFRLKCVSPMHIGVAGFEYYDASLKSVEPRAIVSDANGSPCIPGSSLRGWLREMLPADVQAALFGYGADNDDPGRCGFVDVHTATLLEDTQIMRRFGHARDPITGAVANHMLFAHETVPADSIFSVTLVLRDIETAHIIALLSHLQNVNGSRDTALGAVKQSGLGRVKVETLAAKQLTGDDVSEWLKTPSRSLWEFAREFSLPAGAASNKTWRQWDLLLRPLSAFLCEDADATENSADDGISQVRCPLLSSKKSKAVIPGSTLKGALRSEARRLLQSELIYRDHDISPAVVKPVVDKAIAEIFGHTQQAGVLAVSDFLSQKTFLMDDDARQQRQRTLHASDRFTGGVSGERLFTIEPLFCDQLSGSLSWPLSEDGKIENKAHALWLAMTLREAWLGPFALGWGVSRGLGSMQLCENNQTQSQVEFYRWLEINLPEALDDDTDIAFDNWLNGLISSTIDHSEAQ